MIHIDLTTDAREEATVWEKKTNRFKLLNTSDVTITRYKIQSTQHEGGEVGMKSQL